jgi:hypothetical protein
MVARNYLNAYSGPDALQNYFDPDRTPMIPLVEIPPSLNPYYNDGVRIHAKMMSMHPSNNVKIMPGTCTLICVVEMAHYLLNVSVEHANQGGSAGEVQDSSGVQFWVHRHISGTSISHQPRDTRCPRLLE